MVEDNKITTKHAQIIETERKIRMNVMNEMCWVGKFIVEKRIWGWAVNRGIITPGQMPSHNPKDNKEKNGKTEKTKQKTLVPMQSTDVCGASVSYLRVCPAHTISYARNSTITSENGRHVRETKPEVTTTTTALCYGISTTF